MMRIEIVHQASEELFDAFRRLVPQLTSNNPPPTREDLSALVQSEATALLAAYADDESILGAASVTVYRVPTGIRAIIEDVIVDQSARGRGIGEALVRAALEVARERGAAGVSLTSNPKREAANKLYLKMGFKRRETNAYYFRFE
ncbi:MAG: GNAT family N-acetyltransferase [Chloroflexota bacterium]